MQSEESQTSENNCVWTGEPACPCAYTQSKAGCFRRTANDSPRMNGFTENDCLCAAGWAGEHACPLWPFSAWSRVAYSEVNSFCEWRHFERLSCKRGRGRTRLGQHCCSWESAAPGSVIPSALQLPAAIVPGSATVKQSSIRTHILALSCCCICMHVVAFLKTVCAHAVRKMTS